MQTFGEYGFYAGSFKRLISSSPFKVKLFIIIFANFSFGRQRCKNNPKKSKYLLYWLDLHVCFRLCIGYKVKSSDERNNINICLIIDPENKALEIAAVHRETVKIEAEKNLQTVPFATETENNRTDFNHGEIIVFQLSYDMELPDTNPWLISRKKTAYDAKYEYFLRAVDGNNIVDIGEDDLDNPQSPLEQELALLYDQRKNITIIFGKFMKQ